MVGMKNTKAALINVWLCGSDALLYVGTMVSHDKSSVHNSIHPERWSCVTVEVAVLGSPSLIVLNMVSVDVNIR